MKTIIKPIKNSLINNNNMSFKIVIIIYLYYENTLDYYLQYMSNIPKNFEIIVISSKSKVLEYVNAKADPYGVKITDYILKENRGRDVSALLVSAKEYVLNADYICFVHDKAANFDCLQEDVDFWIRNIWENTLGSSEYIQELISAFNNDNKLGALFPPAPIGKYIDAWIDNAWYKNLPNTQTLALRLGLKVKINHNDSFVSLSNAFWARVDAIRPMFEIDWKYEDFDMEPLPLDGTLSHAIERIWGYIVADRGYDSAVIMTDEYAAEMLKRSTEYSRVMYRFIVNRFPALNYSQMENLDVRLDKLDEYINSHKRIFIYGAGLYGKALNRYFETIGVCCAGFIVTRIIEKEEKDIISIESYEKKNGDGIVIAVSLEKKNEIETVLKTRGIFDYLYGF